MRALVGLSPMFFMYYCVCCCVVEWFVGSPLGDPWCLVSSFGLAGLNGGSSLVCWCVLSQPGGRVAAVRLRSRRMELMSRRLFCRLWQFQPGFRRLFSVCLASLFRKVKVVESVAVPRYFRVCSAVFVSSLQRGVAAQR